MANRYRQLRVIRAFSPGAAAVFSDGYFDLVYIDADHHKEALLADIDVWWDKVRIGGLLSGHDYGTRRFPQVEAAVTERFGDTAEVAEYVWFKRKGWE